MAYNFTTFSSQVQKELGKSGDIALITTTRCGEWINKAQLVIAYDNPGLWDLHTLDSDSWNSTEDQWEYDFSAFSPAVLHVLKIKYVNTTDETYYWIKPYVGGLDAWDMDFPYIPGRGTGYPKWYVRRDKKIEFDLPFSADAAGADIYIYYALHPPVMTGTDTPTLTDCDECLIAKAKAYGYAAMGNKFMQTAIAQHAYANQLIADRVASEVDIEQPEQNTYQGP